MAKDIYHQTVKIALEKEGWIITHDPFILSDKTQKMYYEIDLGAERLLAAEKGTEKIVVEVKSFLRNSMPNEFHGALGQYLSYGEGLEQINEKRELYLAISQIAHDKMQEYSFILHLIEKFKIKLIVFEDEKQEIVSWIN